MPKQLGHCNLLIKKKIDQLCNMFNKKKISWENPQDNRPSEGTKALKMGPQEETSQTTSKRLKPCTHNENIKLMIVLFFSLHAKLIYNRK